MLESFKNEIIEAEKGRTDLLKWKLILIAALGAVGLGIGGDESRSSSFSSLHLVLCLIPFVCVYVDLLCKHLQMRILVISKFFQIHSSEKPEKEMIDFQAYEHFCENVRSVFNLEDWAQHWSTIMLSILVGCAALLPNIKYEDKFALIIFAMLGIIMTIAISINYKNKKINLNEHIAKSKEF